MFPRYNAKDGKYEMEIRPPMQLSEDPEQSARAMNEEIEYFVTPTPLFLHHYYVAACEKSAIKHYSTMPHIALLQAT